MNIVRHQGHMPEYPSGSSSKKIIRMYEDDYLNFALRFTPRCAPWLLLSLLDDDHGDPEVDEPSQPH